MNKEIILERINQFFNSQGKTPQEYFETEQNLWDIQQLQNVYPWWRGQPPQYWQQKDANDSDNYQD